MAKYTVIFCQEVDVNCPREDAIERAIDEYLEEHRKMPEYDYTEVEEVSP